MDWNQVMAIATVIMAFGTIILAIVAIFGRLLSEWFRRPILDVEIINEPPHCHKTFLRKGEIIADCYYFRILVANSGRTSARNVEVFAKELKKKRVDGKYETVRSFSPMNLVWSNIGGMLYPAIHPNTWKHCDVFHVLILPREVISRRNDIRGMTNIAKRWS